MVAFCFPGRGLELEVERSSLGGCLRVDGKEGEVVLRFKGEGRWDRGVGFSGSLGKVKWGRGSC